jgi:glutathione S-transferase
MITVHHLNNSRSQRVLWLLEELGVEYRVQRYQRDPKTMLAPPELRAVHPLGKSPVITDDNLPVGDRTVAESGAVVEYLVDRYGQDTTLRPAGGTSERRRYTYWLHYAEGSAMPPLLLNLIFSKIRTAPMPFFVKPIARGIADKVMQGFVTPQLDTHFDFMESELGQREWFAGDLFSAADIQMSFPIEAAGARGLLNGRPNLKKFLGLIQVRPAYQRALTQGGLYELGH